MFAILILSSLLFFTDAPKPPLVGLLLTGGKLSPLPVGLGVADADGIGGGGGGGGGAISILIADC